MGLFGSIRNILSDRNELQEFWNVPESKEDVDSLIKSSESGNPQIIYKHSYRCSISLFAKSSLDSRIESLLQAFGLEAHLVDVAGMRNISSYIEQKTRVPHQSPQIILLHDGYPFWSATHGDVRIDNLTEAVHDLKNRE